MMSSEAKNVDVSNLLFYSNSSHLRDATTLLRARQFRPMSLFRNAQFEISIAKPSGLPPPRGPEIAFAGRSNAGKSSALNALTDQKNLARTSKTPGRTQLINFFRLQNGAVLVDLPGYGYAEVPEAIRRQWQHLLEDYLTRRPNLIGLVLIMDSRHPLKDRDRTMIGWFAPSGRPIHVLLTKSDKLTRSEAAKVLSITQLQAAGGQVMLFSALKKQGVDEAAQLLWQWAHPAVATQPEAPATDAASEAAEAEPPALD